MASKAIGFLNFKFAADLSGFQRAMKKAQKSLKKFGNNLKKTGKNMTMGLTAPIVGLGVVAIKTFASFEQGMLKVKAVSGATTSEFKALTESAKQLGSETMFSASQVATLQFELSKLGLDPTAILDSTKAILQLAQATDTELGEAAKTTAVALNSYNLEADEASRISDVMALASSSAAMDMEKFGAALPKVAATARISGDSFELMSAKLQVLADSGLEGSRMGTQLKIIYSKLVSAGLTWDEAMGKIQKSTNKISTAQKIFGENAFNAAIILSESAGKLNEYEQANLNAIGTSKKMADIMDSGVGGAFRKLKSQLEGAGIELGEKLVPIFTKFGEKIKAAIKWFTDLSPEQQENIVKWAAIVAAIGPVLWILGQLILVIGGLSKALMFLAANPVVLIIGALVALGIAIYKVMTSTSKFAVTVRNAFREMVNGIIWILNKMIDAFNFVSKKLGGPTVKNIKTLQKETYKAADAVGKLGDAAEKTAEKVNVLNDVNETAKEQTKEQMGIVGSFAGILKDEDAARSDKIKALKELKRISPEYFGQLKIGVSSLEDITTATNNYAKSILKLAKISAVQTKLQAVFAREVDFEIVWEEAAQKMREGAFSGPGAKKMTEKEIIRSLEMASSRQDDGTYKTWKQIRKEFAQEKEDLTNLLKDVDLAGVIFKPTPTGTPGPEADPLEDKKSPFEIDLDALEKNHTLALNQLKQTQLIEQKSDDDFNTILESEEARHLNNMWNLYNQYGEDVTDLDGKIVDKLLANQEKLDEDPFANYRGSLGKLGEKIGEFTGTEVSELEVGLAGIITKLGDELAQGADDFEEYGKNVLGILREVIGGLISTGVSLAITAALESIMKTGQFWMIPILAGAAAGLAKTAFNSLIPAFAQGGLVTGPTTALIGEQSTGANPEVIAPLNKLKSMIGGGQNITVQGRLVGNDIYLSNERTKFNRNRTV